MKTLSSAFCSISIQKPNITPYQLLRERRQLSLQLLSNNDLRLCAQTHISEFALPAALISRPGTEEKGPLCATQDSICRSLQGVVEPSAIAKRPSTEPFAEIPVSRSHCTEWEKALAFGPVIGERSGCIQRGGRGPRGALSLARAGFSSLSIFETYRE